MPRMTTTGKPHSADARTRQTVKPQTMLKANVTSSSGGRAPPKPAQRITLLEEKNTELRDKITKLIKGNGRLKTKLAELAKTNSRLELDFNEKLETINNLNREVSDLESKSDDLACERDVAIRNMKKLADQLELERNSPPDGGQRLQQRSLIPDSVALAYGRKPVERVVTKVRPNLGTRPRPKRPENS